MSITCAYWLINRTGLPLVFRQDGVGGVAAGQAEENEKASTTTPLLFSYTQGDFIDAYVKSLSTVSPCLLKYFLDCFLLIR